jgi:hypothetical protein
MKQALQALIFEMEYVLSCINEDKIPFDGDDFHEALRLGKEALAKQEQDGNVCARCGGIVFDPVIKQEQGKPVISMLEPIGILMKLEGDKHMKIYGMDEQLEQQAVATEEKWDGVLHKGIIHSEKLITSQPKQEQGEPVAQCTNSDTWNCKYCRKTETCKALKDQRNFGQPKQEQGEPDWKALVLNHNAECESRCNMDSCGYKPYFEYSKRRCPNCPVHEMIDVEYTTPQPAQKPWGGLTDDEINQAYAGVYKGIPLHESIEAKLKEKNT